MLSATEFTVHVGYIVSVHKISRLIFVSCQQITDKIKYSRNDVISIVRDTIMWVLWLLEIFVYFMNHM